jgi:hypothetical protein
MANQKKIRAADLDVSGTPSASVWFRGDNTWNAPTKTDVGLGNVVNLDTSTTANITDSADKRFMTDAQETKLDSVETNADVTDAINVGVVNAAATSKATPVDADSIPIVNSEDSNLIYRVTIANLKTLIATYYNSLVATMTNKTLTSPVITTPTGIVKGDVGLGNVDNTSDATKDAATATLTNKTIEAGIFTTSMNGNYLTASEIVITDASKNIVSAPVATYPSLAELAFLKGVTSAIQAQINAKGVGDAIIANGLDQFTGNGTWKVFYSDGSGNTIELALGGAGTVLQSNGAALPPSFATPAGGGDVSKVGTPVDNQVGVWTGDGTIEGTTGLTYDGTNFNITGNITLSGTVDGIDIFVDVTANNAKISFDATSSSKLAGIEALADVTDAVNVGSSINGATAKTTPVDADTMPLIDSAAANVLKKVTWANIKSVIATSYNSLTATMTNKRITPRVGSTTSSATPTINTNNVDFYHLTAQAVAITSFTTNLSGTPTNNQKLWIAITGTAARAITWGASFEDGAVTLPTTTITTQRLDVGFIWNSVTSKWRCMAAGPLT